MPNREFEQWMKDVDTYVIGLSGLSVHDLEDQNFWDMWESGESPQEAAVEILQSCGYPLD